MLFSRHVSAEAPHAANPTVVVVCLAPEIGTYLRVRQNQKTLFFDTRQNTIRNIFRAEDSIDIIAAKSFLAILNFRIFVYTHHACRNRLWANQADMNPAVTVCYGQ
jgi:hypothetical protein